MLETALNPRDARVLMVEDSPNDQAIATRALKNFGIPPLAPGQDRRRCAE